MKNKPLLLLSTLLLLTGCSSLETSSETDSQTPSSDQSSETVVSSHNNSSSSSVSPSSSEIVSSSSKQTAESSSVYESSEEQSSSSEILAAYYELEMGNFDSRIHTVGLKQNYREGTMVNFSLDYDDSEITNVKVFLNDVELNPVGEKQYSFVMPGKKSTLAITAEDVIKKYSITENAPQATITYVNSEIESGKKYPAGTEIQFSVIADTNYGIVNVSITYLTEDNTTAEAELTFESGIYTFYMPEANASINVETAKLYSISFLNQGFAIEYVTGGKTAAAGSSVSFKISQTDPSYLFRSVSIWKNYSYTENTGSGSISYYQDDGVYTFTMPEQDAYVVVTADKRYAVKTEKDENVESVTIDNPKDYYSTADEITFSVAFKEGYKADKVQLVKSDGTTTALALGEDGKYSFKGLTSDVTIKITSKSASEASYWETKTIYYYEMPNYNSNDQKYLEEIIINPDTETVDINVYQNSYEDEWYVRKPALQSSSSSDPYWWNGKNGWSEPMSIKVEKAGYTFDKTTNKMSVVDGSNTYTLTFTIVDGVAESLIIDKAVHPDFLESAGKTFIRWEN